MKKEELLKEAAKNIFSGDGTWNAGCFDKDLRVNRGNLPCHLRDESWLAQLLQTDKTLKYLSYAEILEFVKSDFFQNMRHEYELKTVTWQIKYMTTGGVGWLVPKKYDADFFIFDDNCDLGFRESVILTLTSVGMNQEVIEEGLELNRDEWLAYFISRAFYNQNNILFSFVEVEECSKEYEKAWTNLREYEYYQRNKAMVDKYGKKSLAMQMSNSEAQKLKEFVKIEYQKRQEYLKEVEKGFDTDPMLPTPKLDNESLENTSVKPSLLTRIRNVFKRTR